MDRIYPPKRQTVQPVYSLAFNVDCPNFLFPVFTKALIKKTDHLALREIPGNGNQRDENVLCLRFHFQGVDSKSFQVSQ